LFKIKAYAETVASRCVMILCWPMEFGWKSERTII